MDLKDRVQSFVGHLLNIDDWKEWYMDIETIILHPSYDEQGNMIQFHSFFLNFEGPLIVLFWILSDRTLSALKATNLREGSVSESKET